LILVKQEKQVVKQTLSRNAEKSVKKLLNVLIAEDDLASEILFSKMIKHICKESYYVKSGIDAVNLCRNNPAIDLILMDIKMAGMDGYEATKQIRQFNKKIIIIAQTAYAQIGDKEKALAAGCDDYISKPIKKDELLTLINEYFSD
jgi:CheY-like chemotaxis protein